MAHDIVNGASKQRGLFGIHAVGVSNYGQGLMKITCASDDAICLLNGTAGDVKAWDKGGNLDQSSRVQAVCDWFGPADLLTMGGQSNANSVLSSSGNNAEDHC